MGKIKKLADSSLGLLGVLSADKPSMPKMETVDKEAEIEKRRKREQEAAKVRLGRQANILTSGQGVTDELGTINRPGARSSNLLGGG